MASSPTPSNIESSPSRPTTSSLPGDSFKCPPMTNSSTQDVFHSIVKGRKSWKTLRGGEVVWPPELEAALIEGLENYQPDDSRETRLLGRFPMRNRFISDWIYEKTGKRRTAKQVGSRLQQLRDTCGGKKLLKLLSPIRPPIRPSSLSPTLRHKDDHQTYGPPSLHYDSESSSDSSISSPATPTEAHATLQSLLYRGVEPRIEEIPNNIVYIDVLTSHQASTAGSTTSWTSTPEALAEERSWIDRGHNIARASEQPRHIQAIDPMITLLSQTETSARSHFTVHSDDGVVFSEMTDLEPVDTSALPTADGSLLYRTPMVPGFWDTIVRSDNASKYVIIQHVIPEASSSSSTPTPIFSAMYKFNYATLVPPVSTSQGDLAETSYSLSMAVPLPHSQQSLVDRPEYNFDALDLSLETQSFNDMLNFSKNQNLFGLGPYMHADEWSNASSTESVYTSPVDTSGPHSFSLPMEDRHMGTATSLPTLHAFSPVDGPNYGI
ncbi:hypothetical protein CPB83DRAFT_860393 [Crepidotus variabilis]|uniref:TEA domain-containing protein n=1 Tax=Crepidotus variabilis TaxID=179855 RepID=A0A9P6JLR7_9AGAR|nr:hypothetical protein CPB83DRAFT_860393 [Crepidotus variabilis]